MDGKGKWFEENWWIVKECKWEVKPGYLRFGFRFLWPNSSNMMQSTFYIYTEKIYIRKFFQC